MTMLLDRLPRPSQSVIVWLIELSWLALAVAFAWFTLAVLEVAQFQSSSSLGITMDWVYTSEVVGGIYLGSVALRRLVARARGRPEAAA